MREPSGAVARWGRVSQKRLGMEPHERVAFQPGMPVVREDPPVVREQVRAMARLYPASGRGCGVVGTELAVARRLLPGATIFQGEDALADQLLENSVQGSPIRLVAERVADVVSIEDFGRFGERSLDIRRELPGGPAWRPIGRRIGGRPGRRKRGDGGGRRGARRRARKGTERLPGHRGEGNVPLRGGHPDQIECPELLAAGRFEQLHSFAELRLDASLAFFVFVACHVCARIASQRAREGKGPRLEPRRVGGPLRAPSPIR